MSHTNTSASADSISASTDAAPQVQPQTEHVSTVLFLADPRASVFLLKDTVSTLLMTYRVQHAYVDLTTLVGLTAASELLQAGIAYEHLDFGQQIPEMVQKTTTAKSTGSGAADRDQRSHCFKPSRPRTLQDFAYLEHMSADTHSVEIDKLAEIDANLVLIPTMTAEGVIDFSADTMLGRTLDHIERLGRDALIVMPPERGLRPVLTGQQATSADERYERITVLVRQEATSPAIPV
ncbi:MAG: hypothetical protein B5766_05490 [Candidatus Lumbricidophila eiseniae]|uniref:Uncharacterized protein n=1 Tax=Candidatus Lumbricidiphila eiseniae TaxID=1969409 RepID=A0A2A6FS21_9MICO|nr:MAG: hypothetical protein B5766_05490 [Candidatus Lumbricidophila eiseniae]